MKVVKTYQTYIGGKHMEFKVLTDGVLRELEARGYAESTMKSFNRALSVAVKWFDHEAHGQYDERSHAEYIHHLQTQLSVGKNKAAWYNTKLRCLERIKAYAKNGSIDCGYERCGIKVFVPSLDALAIIESALATENLTEDFKYKLKSNLRRFLCFVEAHGSSVNGITREVMVSYIHDRRDVSSGHMAYIVRSLRVLSEHLVSIGAMKSSPDFKFIAPKRSPRRLLPSYTEQELSAVLTGFDRTSPTGKRDYAVILLAVGTGLRAGDIANLKRTDIDWKQKTISIVQGKTEKPVIIPISGQICNALSDYILSGRPKSDCTNVFLRSRLPYIAFKGGVTLGKIIDRGCARAGIEKKKGRSFHSLRRTFGTWLAAEEVQLTMIFQMLGQERMDSSKPYLSFNDAQISSCAMGFDDIPLKGGVYGELR